MGGADFHGDDRFTQPILAPGLGLGGGDQPPETGDLAGAGEAEPRQGAVAGPVDEGLGGDLGGARALRDDPFGEIIDLLETPAPGNRQAAAAPEIFERRLAVVPFPPAAAMRLAGAGLCEPASSDIKITEAGESMLLELVGSIDVAD